MPSLDRALATAAGMLACVRAPCGDGWESVDGFRLVHGLAAHLVQVMTVVKRLVKSGITICATIHSPTPYGAAAVLDL